MALKHSTIWLYTRAGPAWYLSNMETTAALKAERAALQAEVQAMAGRGLKSEDAARHAKIDRINRINRELAKRRPAWG